MVGGVGGDGCVAVEEVQGCISAVVMMEFAGAVGMVLFIEDSSLIYC